VTTPNVAPLRRDHRDTRATAQRERPHRDYSVPSAGRRFSRPAAGRTWALSSAGPAFIRPARRSAGRGAGVGRAVARMPARARCSGSVRRAHRLRPRLGLPSGRRWPAIVSPPSRTSKSTPPFAVADRHVWAAAITVMIPA
jgi:hypothetical protein